MGSLFMIVKDSLVADWISLLLWIPDKSTIFTSFTLEIYVTHEKMGWLKIHSFPN